MFSALLSFGKYVTSEGKITPKMAIIAQIKIECIIKLHDTPNPSKLTVYVFALFDCFTMLSFKTPELRGGWWYVGFFGGIGLLAI